MILIKLSKDLFGYDIESLVRAFYLGEKVVVKTLSGTSKQRPDMVLTVEYFPDKVQIATYERMKDPEFQISGHVMTFQDEAKIEDYDDRLGAKNTVKKLLYQMLTRRTKMELPWGTLTGIRPIKLALDLLEEGSLENEVRRRLRETYLVSEQKIDLTIEVAKEELAMLSPYDYASGYSVYIGIPFCPTTCAYCSFTSYPIHKYHHKVDAYLDAMFQEIDYIAETFKFRRLYTVYIGGGTPTSLSAEELERLLNKVVTTLDMEDVLEFSVEAGRPDSITKEKLEVMKKYGVTRISINPQTLKDETLHLIGRAHNMDQFYKAFAMARECGFDNINTDLILGLPNENKEDVKRTLEKIGELSPENVTIHSLAIKRAARLNQSKEMFEKYYYETDASLMDEVLDACRNEGYHPYYLYRQKNMTNHLENIGLAKLGYNCLYNILIMEEKQTIIGIGAGSVTKFIDEIDGKLQCTKVDNVKDVDLYIERIQDMIGRKDEYIKRHYKTKEAVMDPLWQELPEHLAHGMNVSNLAYEIAKEYGLAEAECKEIAVAGMLHDIGKICLHHYLNGKTALQVEEMRYIRMHSTFSYQLLKKYGFSDYICQAVYHHHENMDGTGFPDNLKGDEIPLAARILRVCDEYLALISDRGYRAAFDRDTAITLMLEDSKNFDVKVLLAFLRAIHEIDFEKITIERKDIIKDGID